MPGTNWRVAHGVGQLSDGESEVDVGVEGDDWRTQLPPCSRHRVVYKMMETLRSLCSLAGHEYLQDLEETAVGYEENIFTAATSQPDYFRKIYLKMLALEKKSQQPLVNSRLFNAASNNRDSQRPGFFPVLASGTEGRNWKIMLHPEARRRIVNNIVQMLRRYLPSSELEGEEERVLSEMAARFEENVFDAASSQTEYVREISSNMLTLASEGRFPTTHYFPSILQG